MRPKVLRYEPQLTKVPTIIQRPVFTNPNNGGLGPRVIRVIRPQPPNKLYSILPKDDRAMVASKKPKVDAVETSNGGNEKLPKSEMSEEGYETQAKLSDIGFDAANIKLEIEEPPQEEDEALNVLSDE